MRRRFFFKNLAFFIIPLLIPLLIYGTLSIIFTENNIKKDINKSNIKLLNQAKENVELVLSQINNLSLIYDTNTDIGFEMDSIFQNTPSTYESNGIIKIIKGFMKADSIARPYIYSTYVYYDSADKNFFSSIDGIATINEVIDNSWFQNYKKKDRNINLWTETRKIKQYAFEEKPFQVISIYRRTLSRRGIIVLNILPGYIENILKNATPLADQSLLITNEDNEIFFKNSNIPYLKDIDLTKILKSPSDFFTMKFAGDYYIITKLQSKNYGWKYISIVPQHTLYELPLKLSSIMVMLLIAALIIGIILAYYITSKNSKQIYNIINILDSAEKGQPLPPLPDRIKDEYSYIINNILKTFIESSFIKIALSEKKFKMRTLELLALQSQMNPHFLFNTMKTIYWKSFSLTDGPNDVSEMIENLSDILNYSMGDPDKTVTIETEIKRTESYINIQKVRYKCKFDVIWEYDKEVLEYEVIKLLLQPLIENSIYHGIKGKEGFSLIKIKILILGSVIRFAIIDNGLGIKYDRLREIQCKLHEEGEFQQHIGLFNTNKRICLKYGDKYGITIRSKYGLGTVIYITIPTPKKIEG